MKKQFIGKFQKAVAMLVVATMLLATMVTAFPVFAETITSYNGDMFELKGAGGNFEKITGFSTDDLVEGLHVHNTSLEHTTGYTNSTGTYFYWDCIGNEGTFATLAEDEGIALSSTGALMFYVKLPANQGETKIYPKFESFAYNPEGDNTRVWHYDNNGAANRDFYLLEMGNTEWQSFKTEALGSSANNPAAVLPAGFEGWVRIPVANYANATKLETQRVHRVDFFFDNLTTDAAYLGALMAVDNANENLTEVVLGEEVYNLIERAAYKATALNATEFVGNDLYSLNTDDTSNAQTVGLFGKGNSINLSVDATDDTNTTYYSDKYYTADFAPYTSQGGGNAIRGGSAWGVLTWPSLTSDFASGTGAYKGFKVNNASTDANISDGIFSLPAETLGSETYYAYLGLKSDGVSTNNTDYTLTWKSGSSFLFYTENTGVTSNKVSFTMNNSAWIHLYKDKDYYLLSETSAEWKAGTTVAVHSNDRGYIELPAGFKGWVRVPCDNFLNWNKQPVTDKEVKDIKVFIANLGGEYGELNIGEFGIVDSIESLRFISSTYTENKPVNMINSPYNASEASGISNTYRPLNETCPLAVTPDTSNNAFTISVNNLSTSTLLSDGVYVSANPRSDGIYAIAQYSSAPILASNGSIMMYLDHTDSTQDVKLVVGQEWYLTQKERSYYLLAKNSSNWQALTTETINTNEGYVIIPAGFEGWLRIPASTFKSGKEYTAVEPMPISKIYIWPNAIGGTYGSLTVSKVSVLAETDDRYYLDFGNKAIDLAGNEVSTELFDEMVSYDVSVSDGKVTSSPLASSATVEATTLNDGEGIMFYAKTTDAANIKLALSKTNTTVDGFTYSYIQYNDLWTSVTSTDGTIALPANFEGWVKLSAEAFIGTDIDCVAIGFANTSACELSNFAIINQASKDLDYIIVNGEKQSLFVEILDANADGVGNILDLVRMKKYVAEIPGTKVAEIGADIDRVNGVNAADLTLFRKYLLGDYDLNSGEEAVSRFLAQEGYTTAANYESNTATVENVNF